MNDKGHLEANVSKRHLCVCVFFFSFSLVFEENEEVRQQFNTIFKAPFWTEYISDYLSVEMWAT